jgi:hypothetical protein
LPSIGEYFLSGGGGISVLHGISNYRYLIETDEFSQKQISCHNQRPEISRSQQRYDSDITKNQDYQEVDSIPDSCNSGV